MNRDTKNQAFSELADRWEKLGEAWRDRAERSTDRLALVHPFFESLNERDPVLYDIIVRHAVGGYQKGCLTGVNIAVEAIGDAAE